MGEKTLTIKADENGLWKIDLKTVEIDVENGVFKINGIDFGKRCIGFAIRHDAFETTLTLTENIIAKQK